MAGGRLAEGTFPRLCIPCLRLSWDFTEDGSEFSFYNKLKQRSIEYITSIIRTGISQFSHKAGNKLVIAEAHRKKCISFYSR